LVSFLLSGMVGRTQAAVGLRRRRGWTTVCGAPGGRSTVEPVNWTVPSGRMRVMTRWDVRRSIQPPS
jgi:hypothetical protein